MPEAVDIECAACSSRNVYAVEQWPAGERARAMACRECGLLFLHRLPERGVPNGHGASAHEQLERIWPFDGASTSATKKGAALALMAAVDRYVLSPEASAAAPRVLGVGSGADAWLNVFLERQWETFAVGSATAAVPVRHELLPDLPSDPRFDLVIAYRVLERAPRPLEALQALARTIRRGGGCFVGVPRLDALAVHRRVRYCLRQGKHTAAFTESCLRGLFARAGLEVIATSDELDHPSASGESLVLRLLARKVDVPAPEPDPAAALAPVLHALQTLDDAEEPAIPPSAPAPTACPACTGSHVQSVDEWRLPGNEAHAASCGDCGLLFVYPQPSPEALDAYYAPEGGWSASRTNRRMGSEPDMGSEGAMITMLSALDRHFPATRPAAGARVFDFGCGTGAWLNSFQDRGWDTYGLEPSSSIAFTRHARLQAVPSEPRFDLVLAYHVLEHLPRPLETMRELAGALAPGGFFLVSVPRIDTLAVHRQVDYCLHPRHHIVGFTEACMRGLLGRAGLEVVESFHSLDTAWSKGVPVRLQLLARKTTAPPMIEQDAAPALKSVIAAFTALKDAGRARPGGRPNTSSQ